MLRNLLNFVLQNACPLRDRSTSTVLCSDCYQRLSCDRCSNPKLFWNHQPKVFAWGNYANTLKRTIAAMKYDRHPELAIPLGESLARSWLQFFPSQKLTIVPIPLHRDREQERGFNQAERLARAFCNVTNDRLFPQALQRIRATAALFNLSAGQREQTVADAFILDQNFRPNAPVLLIDDIYTTGATVRSCLQVLHQHNIEVLGVAVVAKTQKSSLTLPHP